TREEAPVVEKVVDAYREPRLSGRDESREVETESRVELEKARRLESLGVRVVEPRSRDVAACEAGGDAGEGRRLGSDGRDEWRRQERRDVVERARRRANEIARRVVHVIELRPVADPGLAQVRGRREAQRRQRLPGRIQLQAAPRAPVDVRAEGKPDRRELARERDLVVELHVVEVRLENEI